MHAHAVSMRTHGLSVCTHMCICVCTLRVSHGLYFSKINYFFQKKVLFSTNTFLKSIFIWLGSEPTLGFRVLPSMGNRGPSRKWRYRIFSVLNLRATPWNFQKYYLFSIVPWKHLDWHGATSLGIKALKVPFPIKLFKMPLVNLGLTKSQTRSKFFRNDIFHAFTSNPSHLEIFVNFD